MTAVMIALRFDTPKSHSGGVSDVLGQGFPMSWNQTPPSALIGAGQGLGPEELSGSRNLTSGPGLAAIWAG